MPWLSRFGLHLAAAIGATGVLLVATTVGAMQTRQAVTARSTATAVSRAGLLGGGRTGAGVSAATPGSSAGTADPTPAAQATPTPAPAAGPAPDSGGTRRSGPLRGPGANGAAQPGGAPANGPQAGPGAAQPGAATPRPGPLPRQHSVTGVVLEVSGSDLTIRTPAGREGVIRLGPKAIVRLGGKAVDLSALEPGDRLVAVGQLVAENELRAVAVLARRPPGG